MLEVINQARVDWEFHLPVHRSNVLVTRRAFFKFEHVNSLKICCRICSTIRCLATISLTLALTLIENMTPGTRPWNPLQMWCTPLAYELHSCGERLLVPRSSWTLRSLPWIHAGVRALQAPEPAERTSHENRRAFFETLLLLYRYNYNNASYASYIDHVVDP